MRTFNARTARLIAALSMLIAMVPGVAAADHGYLTSEAAMIALADDLPKGAYLIPIISSGETVGNTRFQGIPDGVGLRPGPERNTVEAYVAHEETTVPFFGSADFVNASVTTWVLRTNGPHRGAIMDSGIALSSDEGYLRFCSASMAGPAEGFDDYVFLTGEESNDIVPISAGQPFEPDPGIAPNRQAGFAVAINTDTGDFTHIDGMGRLNHENTVGLPGYDEIALITTDDTFTGPSAQLYLYRAADQDAVFNDEGTLWAFQVTAKEGVPLADPGNPFNNANDYLDIRPGDDWQGQFIPVPDEIADGDTGVAPQQALEDWSNENNVFQFLRLEDLAVDKNDPSVVYVADTGRTRVIPDPATGRLKRGPSGTVGLTDNGAVFRFVFDDADPTKVTSFSMMAQGDDSTLGAFVPFVSPDNMDTSKKSLMVQEDADDARIWMYDFSKGDWSVVAQVTHPDSESSGIVDASKWFGQGTWILTVQGHGENVIEETDSAGVLRKLESGQLLFMKIPGS